MKKTVRRGAEFLLTNSPAVEVFTPEDFGDKRKSLAQEAHTFVVENVLPNIAKIDEQQFDISVDLIRKAGEKGYLKIEAPTAYGGLHLDIITSMLITEKLGGGGSFSVTYAAHTGIGTFPLQYYGTQAQKDKYLAKLLNGEWIGAYALTEPTSGSDALGAKTTAVLSDDGTHYVLNGRKQFITNAAFADIFTVFAKVDGDKFTAFLIEKGTEGLTTGPEEKKMGIRGSSTRRLILDNVKVPVENVLGEIGKGHKIAFNALNLGRFKLGAAVTGGAKVAFRDAVKRIKTRKQFGRELMHFGLMKEKIADMTATLFIMESAIYRLAGQIADHVELLDDTSPTYSADYLKQIEEFSAECALTKVLGSDGLAFIVDEAVQVFGGYGFIEAFNVERYYRDERINRIYEGTNEINRLLASGVILKKAIKGELPLVDAAMKAMEKLMTPSFDELPDVPFAEEKRLIDDLKTLYLVLAGQAFQRFGDRMDREQETLASLTDVILALYGLESAVLRAEKHIGTNPLLADVAKVVAVKASESAAEAARRAAYYSAEGDTLTMLLSGIRRWTKYDGAGLLTAKRNLAEAAVARDDYPFEVL